MRRFCQARLAETSLQKLVIRADMGKQNLPENLGFRVFLGGFRL